MGRRRWTYRSALLASAGSAALVVLMMVWLLRRTAMSDGADVATVLGLTVSLATALAGFRGRPPVINETILAEKARALAAVVSTTEARALAQLLGDTGEPLPANVGYAQVDESLVEWRCDGGEQTGTLSTIKAYYGSLTVGRLVVLGEAGSGKTVVALRLLLDQIAALRIAPAGLQLRVPLRMSLPAFTATGESSAELRRELDRWISGELVSTYNVEPTVASALLTGGWILPILDGLDELDAESSSPGRARDVLAALNLDAGPVIVTCRTRRYREITEGVVGQALQDATAVTLQPLDGAQVIAWLEHRLPRAADRKRWRPVLAKIRAHPRGRLARCLSSPLRLYLALTVYRNPTAAPRQLCELPADELDAHLFGQLTVAVTELYPRKDGSRYTAAQVERWMQTLSGHLSSLTGAQGSTSDFALNDLWQCHGSTPGRRFRHLAFILLLPIMFGASYVGLKAMLAGTPVPGGSLVTLGWAILFGRILHLAVSRRPFRPGRTDLRQTGSRRTSRGLRSAVLAGIKAGPSWGMIAMLGFGLATNDRPTEPLQILRVLAGLLGFGLTAGLLFGALAGLCIGLFNGITVIHNSATKPSEPHRHAVTSALLSALAISGMFGLMKLGSPLITVVSGFVFGVVASFAVSGVTAWYPQYLLYVFARSRADDLPRRLPEFLDWAYDAGLLRMSGTRTQFRHREVQEHFAA
ncbi:NACHT domain-containing protein [Kribbella antibiotica]|uniref:NACHT domain-containing protein n=1 Tax=Kribbella antibiotica TaxID=190195 RepID=A0A4R4ZGG1_9ACTN|nr:NACHT domain-containing protein [Kribbella antibiotica]TDD57688.1 NACHT domain-containing protein [Kribbella antibiotica]